MKPKGVFTHDDIAALVAAQRIVPLRTFDTAHINNASLDITVTGEIYEIDAVLKPRQQKERVRDLLPLMNAREYDLSLPLWRGKSYLAKASINVNFPPGIYGYANAKSTSGRLFLQSRLLVDYVAGFDTADLRHQGLTAEVWLVLEPLCFNIMLSVQERYSQLRIFDADTRFTNIDLLSLCLHENILYRRPEGGGLPQPYSQGDLNLFTHDGSVLMTLFAKGTAPIGYAVREFKKPGQVDVARRDCYPGAYFEPLYATQLIVGNEHSWGVWLEANRYYLLATNELVKVSEYLSLVLKELDSRHGDTTVHFAGFADPGFFGTVTLEMRSPRPVFLRHKSPVVTGIFERMRGETPLYNGNYQGQVDAKLPKQFAPFKLSAS